MIVRFGNQLVYWDILKGQMGLFSTPASQNPDLILAPSKKNPRVKRWINPRQGEGGQAPEGKIQGKAEQQRPMTPDELMAKYFRDLEDAKAKRLDRKKQKQPFSMNDLFGSGYSEKDYSTAVYYSSHHTFDMPSFHVIDGENGSDDIRYTLFDEDAPSL